MSNGWANPLRNDVAAFKRQVKSEVRPVLPTYSRNLQLVRKRRG